jgi:hypothetical protein
LEKGYKLMAKENTIKEILIRRNIKDFIKILNNLIWGIHIACLHKLVDMNDGQHNCLTETVKFSVHGSVHCNNILVYKPQQEAQHTQTGSSSSTIAADNNTV